jgi:hypothetical protein
VGKSNQVFAALLEHLAEVEARGLHRTRACTSLYTYCIYELRFSEDAAARRAGAAKLAKRFPVLLDAIAKGELHLTGLLMLGPHLTEANCVDVLGRAKFRTKKEIGKLIRSLAPLPDVPDSIEPLRPALPRALRRPTWEEFVQSFCPPVRELKPGERPGDWVSDTVSESVVSEPAMFESTTAETSSGGAAGAENQTGSTTAPARVADEGGSTTAPALVADLLEVPPDLPPVTRPQLYQMQFTTNEEHVELVERAKGLLSKKMTLGELHLQAMRLLVETLEKRRFGAHRETLRQRGERTGARSRHIPAATRRAVFERDQGRCTFVDERGERCRETQRLEIDHERAFGKGGGNEVGNLRLRCRAHNALTAEEDFGREHIEEKRDGCRHESLRVATTP